MGGNEGGMGCVKMYKRKKERMRRQRKEWGDNEEERKGKRYGRGRCERRRKNGTAGKEGRV